MRPEGKFIDVDLLGLDEQVIGLRRRCLECSSCKTFEFLKPMVDPVPVSLQRFRQHSIHSIRYFSHTEVDRLTAARKIVELSKILDVMFPPQAVAL